jgi:1,4-dihydroxy-2-naphthoyl-CoA hydrolase
MSPPRLAPVPGDHDGLLSMTREGVHRTLGVELVSASPERVELRLEVGPRVHQPYGLLHGGVSALVAESAASIGGALNVPPGHGVVGIELNASHLRAVRSGTLTAVATPARVGRRVQVWTIELTDDAGRAVCVARCTLSVIELPTEPAAQGATT